MQSQFEELKQQNAIIGELQKLMSAHELEHETQNFLDLEERKLCIDETIVNKEKWLESQIASGEDTNEEEYTTAQIRCCCKNDRRSKAKLRSSWSQETQEPFYEVLRTLSKD